eukprot:6471582-Amphidinium_carterae.1
MQHHINAVLDPTNYAQWVRTIVSCCQVAESVNSICGREGWGLVEEEEGYDACSCEVKPLCYYSFVYAALRVVLVALDLRLHQRKHARERGNAATESNQTPPLLCIPKDQAPLVRECEPSVHEHAAGELYPNRFPRCKGPGHRPI